MCSAPVDAIWDWLREHNVGVGNDLAKLVDIDTNFGR